MHPVPNFFRIFIVLILKFISFTLFTVGLLRNSSIHGSSRIFSVHVAGHECSDGNVRQTVKDRHIVSNRNVASAERAIIGLLLKLHDGNFNDKHPLKVDGHVPLIQSILDNVSGHTELPLLNRDADLTVCTPKTKRSGKGSGFGFKFFFQDFEKVIDNDMLQYS